jgi:O-methyltransferase
MPVTRLRTLMQLGLIDWRLLHLAWNLVRNRKTFLSFAALLGLAQNFLILRTRRQSPLRVAEFGVGRGGSATFLGWLIGQYGGTLALYDVFSRIPAPSSQDGIRAQERYSVILRKENSEYYGNIPNLLDIVKSELLSVCPLDRVEFVVGQFEDLPQQAQPQHPFDLVHIDCDWYASYKAVLHFVKENLAPDSILQLDDYSNWQGSRMAIDESQWLKDSQRKLVDGALVIDTRLPRKGQR